MRIGRKQDSIKRLTLAITALALICLPVFADSNTDNEATENGAQLVSIRYESSNPSVVTANTQTSGIETGNLQLKPLDTLESPTFTLARNDSSNSNPTKLIAHPAKKESIQLSAFSTYGRSPNTSKAGDYLFATTILTSSLLQAADYFTTVKAMQYENLTEGNPLMKPFAKQPYAFAAVKIGITSLSFVLMKSVYKKSKTAGWVLSAVTNMALSYVVANNLRMISIAENGCGAPCAQ